MVKIFKNPWWAVLSAVALVLAAVGPASPKVEGDTIIIGAAVSLLSLIHI